MRTASLGASGARLTGRDGGLRLLEYAIAASLALHALAFVAIQRLTSDPGPIAAAPGAISARLVGPQSPQPTVTSAAAAEPAPAVPAATAVAPPQAAAPVPAPMAGRQLASQAQSTAAPKPEPRVSPKSEPKAKSKPAPVAKPPADAASGPAAKSAGALPLSGEAPSSSAPPGVLAPAATLPAAGSAAPALDEDVLARYRAQLIGAARRYKRYPRAAMDNQWEGAAEVAMLIDAHGKIREMTIASSSGHPVLDQQAVEMFRKAKPLVPIPAALRGRDFRVTLKAIYSLRDPGGVKP